MGMTLPSLIGIEIAIGIEIDLRVSADSPANLFGSSGKSIPDGCQIEIVPLVFASLYLLRGMRNVAF